MPLPRLLVPSVLLVALLSVQLSGPPAAATDTDPVGVWPLQPRPSVVRGFDPPDVVWGPGHRGVDLLGLPGQEVRAALAGTVTFAGVLAGRGVVVVSHGDTRTTYEPVIASVEVGTTVAQAARIGRLAFAGSHCLPRDCLHWGWLRDETYLDPLGLVGAAPVRLLPLWRDSAVGLISVPMVGHWPRHPWAGPYAAVLQRLASLARSPRSPDPPINGVERIRAQARGCACS